VRKVPVAAELSPPPPPQAATNKAAQVTAKVLWMNVFPFRIAFSLNARLKLDLNKFGRSGFNASKEKDVYDNREA
jgi:hypothetical protein